MAPGSNSQCKIAPSILSADFSRLGEQVEAVDAAGGDLIHIDVMDGHFVPQITVGPGIVRAVKKRTNLPLDVHLMIEHPERQVKDFASAGADFISVHQEACADLPATLNLIREHGVKPGVVINPATEVETIEPVLDLVDMVLVMSVNPGLAGQAFMAGALDKLRTLEGIRRQRSQQWLLEVDGGIKPANAASVVAAGADILVAGSAIFDSDNYAATIQSMRG